MSKNKMSNAELTKQVKLLKRENRRTKPEKTSFCTQINDNVLTAQKIYEVTDVGSAPTGEKITLTDFEVRLMLHTVPNAASFQFHRVMILRSKVGTLVAADMPALIHDCPNHEAYAVLYDKSFNSMPRAWNDTSAVYAGYDPATIKYRKKYKAGLTVKYDGTNAAEYNPIYVVIITDQVASSIARSDGYILVRYVDPQ